VERQDPRAGWIDRLAARAAGPFRRWRASSRRRWAQLVRDVAEHGRALDGAGDTDILIEAGRLRERLASEGFAPPLVARAFALVREVAGRTVGFRHHDVQLIGGSVLLHGMVAEMDTGEGKTLTATLAASTAALAGLPVHVVTVNDYLASRDAEVMGPVYRALGLSVGLIVHGMTPDERRAAYAADVTYCTNKELGFDYLKDRLVLGRERSRLELQLERLGGDDARLGKLVLRGLCFAIVDEADSVLIDEARTPLIISAPGQRTLEHRTYAEAVELARGLEAGRDFLTTSERAVGLTPDGRERLAALAAPLGGLWTGPNRREELVQQALVALHQMVLDQHYLVRDNKVQIIDEYTGRVYADRSWERGLHQMVEVKEGCEVTSPNEPLARISYQRLFRRYLRLAGMTGTGREVRGELWNVYRLPVIRVPTHRPVQRRILPDRVFRTAEEKWAAVVARIDELHRAGHPVLVGTRSVAASDEISRRLTAAGLPHQVLNARQDKDEAAVVAAAGEPGRITVATNMAGRGTDIKLTPEVVAAGGLHVIATERHESERIDRQLFGRCGRQGDPGLCEAILSLEDELVVQFAPRGARWLGARTFQLAQRVAERRHSQARRALLGQDKQTERALAFSGRRE
jgi:preprotein translocase subunit SecA